MTIGGDIEKLIFSSATRLDKPLRDLLDALPTPVTLQRRGGGLVFANAAARALFEGSVGFKGGDIGTLKAVEARVSRTGQHGDVEVCLPTCDGHERWFLAQVRLGDGLVVTTFTDIADRKEAQQYRQEFRAFIDFNPQIPWTADPTGAVLDAGPKWMEWTGIPLEISRGRGWLEALHPEDRERVAKTWADTTRRALPLDLEYRLKMTSGDYRWFRARATPKLSVAGEVEKWYGTLEDIDDRHAALAALKETEARFRAMADDAPVMIWVADEDGGNTYHSRLWRLTTGQSEEDAKGEGWLKPIHPDDRDNVYAAYLRARNLKCAYTVEYRLRRADGSWAWVIDVGHPRIGRDGHLIGYVGSVLDISDRRRAEEERQAAQLQLSHMARHDMLTGLPNRMHFSESIDALATSAPEGQKVGVLLLDLDGFKSINDTMGHPTGYQLLKQVADRLREKVGPTDVVARFGGDEFAIVVHSAQDDAALCRLAQDLIDTIREPFTIDRAEITIGTSIGIASTPEAGPKSDELIKAADIALYEAKRGGRGAMRLFVSAMDAQIQAREAIKSALAAALDRNQFVLFYQPIVDLRDRKVTGHEALIRWDHPQRGLIPPAEFISLAEESGLIVPIGAWVIEQAMQTASGWSDDISVAINLSPVQFRSSRLVENVRDSLARSGVAPQRVQLEITESVLLESSEANLHRLRALRNLGVKIALDDFGAGYSSLGYLRSFPFDSIKLDRSFIKDLPANRESLAIVRAVATLGRSLDIVTTAEGIETREHLRIVLAEGFDQAQGYFFGRPSPTVLR
jgi:diguanylate cyclase (GGDEF)-like protein/PAS domain S-box-containing protein